MTLRTRAIFAVLMVLGFASGAGNLQNASPAPTLVSWTAAMVFAIVATAPRRRTR